LDRRLNNVIDGVPQAVLALHFWVFSVFS